MTGAPKPWVGPMDVALSIIGKVFKNNFVKNKVLEFIDTYRKIYDFAEIIPTSALRGQNVDDVIDSIFK